MYICVVFIATAERAGPQKLERIVNLTGEDLRRRLLELHESLIGQTVDPSAARPTGWVGMLAALLPSSAEDSKPNVALLVDGISLEGLVNIFTLNASLIHTVHTSDIPYHES